MREVTDDVGNPTGGEFSGVGTAINWQDGPLGVGENRKEQNGAFVEDVLLAAKVRLEFFQNSKFKCRENALAITKIEEALHWLDHRTSGGVEGHAYMTGGCGWTHPLVGRLAGDDQCPEANPAGVRYQARPA